MRIYNSLTRQKEEFKPADPKKVKMFVCGPTVYDYIHVGNARTYTVFDVVAKYLRYKGYDVEYIQNITDIDDKIINRALELGRDPLEYAKDYSDVFLEDIKKLGINSVNRYEPATKNIEQVIKQVQALIDKGNAYKIENDGWYFDLKTFPEYGKLSGRTVEMAEDGVSRIDESLDKRNHGDFSLWKFSKPEGVGWDSKLGYGRPGWHIEDTAITERYFGPQYDLHGAGADLIFPHHEAEIAQQESASGLKPFVRYWMHVGFLINKTQKMSKSLGNFLILREALKKYRPEILRFYFLSTHYRSPLDFSEDILKQAEAAVHRISEFNYKISTHDTGSHLSSASEVKVLGDLYKKMIAAMDDDLNIPMALGFAFETIKKTNELMTQNIAVNQLSVLVDTKEFLENILGVIPKQIKIDKEINDLATKREAARLNNDFSEADRLRKEIHNMGYEIDDTTYGPLIKKSP